MPDLHRARRDEVLAYFENGWTLTEVLFAALQGEQAFRRPPYHRLRHPMIFYCGHTAAFTVNKLVLAGLAESIDEDYETVFAVGVDEMSWDDLSQTETRWPSVREVWTYRRKVHGLVRQLIETHPGLADGHAPIDPTSPLWALAMTLEHERIHLELSSVLVRELPIELVQRPEAWPADHPTFARGGGHEPREGIEFPSNGWISVPAATLTIGKPREWPSYGWDNEYGERRVHVRPFRASKMLVSNGEYLAFVRAGGYLERRHWGDEGWAWRCYRNAKWPTFWVADGPAGSHRFQLRACFEVVPMPWACPVEVNVHEAEAFAAWRRARDGDGPRYRVLTEAEHHRLRAPVVATPNGRDDAAINAELGYGSPSAVDAFPASPTGHHDVFGNAWEWCADDFHPLSGFHVHPLYDDFSSPCFDGKHRIVLGGSWISTGDEASAFARFHFRAHFFQHVGFRLACSDDGDDACDAVRLDAGGGGARVYETDDLFDQYMMLHFGADADAMPYDFGPRGAVRFPKRCAALLAEAAQRLSVPTARALDIGCAVGGAAFELARTYEAVVGVDLSASFIRAAEAMRHEGALAYRRRDEGDLGAARVARVDPAIERARASFRRADACALPSDLVDYDAVLLANLLCRLPSPRALLERLGGPRGIVRRGGLALIVSPYSWMESFTPREVWLGGKHAGDHGAPVSSRDGLRAALGAEFTLVEERDMPLVIREHARKFQYIVSHATLWRRRVSVPVASREAT